MTLLRVVSNTESVAWCVIADCHQILNADASPQDSRDQSSVQSSDSEFY